MPLPVKKSDDPPADAVRETPTLHLSSREVPPGGLSYKIAALAERAPRDAWVGPFNDSDTLTKEVNRRERANGLALSSLADVEHQNCQRLPPGFCRDAREQPTRTPGSLALSLAEVISGTIALLRWFLHGSVGEAEIVRRTYVCNDCPMNRPITGCTGCAASSLHSLVNRIVVGKPLPSDAVLHACFACKCSLKAKVRMPLADVQRATGVEARAHLWERCWILVEEAGEPLRSDPRT